MHENDAPYALVVDDDAIIRMHASDILEAAGFRCLQAGNVDEALGLLDMHCDDVVLLFTDVQMPGPRDGFDLAAETARRWPDVGILVASGDRTPGDGQMPSGAIFIGKPFSQHVVHERLLELLPDGQRPEPLRRKAAAG